MELHTIQVTNFRSIKDSGVVPLDDIACLVGKNESGKTNLLQALMRVNPIPGQPKAFDVNDDYPRAEASTMEHKLADKSFPRPIAVTVEYRLDDDDIAAVATNLGEGVFKPTGNPKSVTVKLDYSGKKTWDVQVDQEKAIEHIVSVSGVEGKPTTAKTIPEFYTALGEVIGSEGTESEESKTKAQVAIDIIKGWRDSNLAHAVIDALSKREPIYMYFDEYATLPPRGNVRELLTKRQDAEVELSDSDRTFLALIDEAQINLERVSTQEYPELRNGLESASIRISGELNEYWSQNQRSRIDFDHTYEDVPGEPEGTKRDLILMIRVEDTKYHVSTSIARRSSGFVWFFSFMVNFSRIRDQFPDRPLVLLLDEPGTSLHGLAQRDFLKVLDGKLGDHQIIYTTHQPFLVKLRTGQARPCPSRSLFRAAPA
ncbi:MAG TPA: AAA family ATPase [Solirubrobacteraceae bacterium]|jgi:energy-coupling factor transporter ATP-binding protein EcfA2|nr:AAA family ATPase [Solirubrobacteraceae bacterium]